LCAAITAQGAGLDAIRTSALAEVPAADGPVPALIPFDADTRQILERTFHQALRLGHNYVGTEHLLLALLESGPGAGTLTGAGVTMAATEAHIVELLAPFAAVTESDPAADGSVG
jgi:hypothetical protein